MRRPILIALFCLSLLIMHYNQVHAYTYTLKQQNEVIDDGTGGKSLWVRVYLENYGDETTPPTSGAKISLHLWYSNSSQGDLVVNDSSVPILGIGPHGTGLIYNKMIPLSENMFNNKYNLSIIIGPYYAPLGFVFDVLDLRKPVDFSAVIASSLKPLREKLNLILNIISRKFYR